MRKYLRVTFVFLILLFSISKAQNFAKSHIHASHVCDGTVPNNCFGYAQARAMGKTVGDAVCNPQASYASGIDLTKFTLTSDPNLVGIRKGDIVILNANNQAAGHAAVVSYVPTSPFNINNILVDQVPNSNGSEQLNVSLGSQIAIYGEPIGYCATGYWKRVSVVLLNNFDAGTLEADKTIIEAYPHGGQLLQKPSDIPDPYPFTTVGNGCWALFAPTSGTNINTLVRAIDNQNYNAYDRKFARWERDYGEAYGTSLLLQEPESGSCTYSAMFSKVYDITCLNDFAGAGGGSIIVEGTSRNAGWIEPITENIDLSAGQITLQAVDNQVISGTEYVFDHWSTGNTSNPCTFTVTGHQSITAVFKEKLVVNLTGPDFLEMMAQGTFTANPSGGSGSYTNYRWWERNDGGASVPNSIVGNEIITAAPGGQWVYQSGWEGQQSVQVARRYSFSLKCEVTDSNNEIATDIHSVTVENILPKVSTSSVADIPVAVPDKVVLQGNYPNPFNPLTTIKFGLPSAAKVLLQVYNSGGQLVATIIDSQLDAGFHTAQFNGQNLSSGIYLYRLTAGNYTEVKRMLLVK